VSPDAAKSRSGSTRRGSKRAAAKPSSIPTGPSREQAQHVPWTIRPASEQARKEWEQASDQEPLLMQAERERLRERPLDRSANPRRTAQLRAGLATRKVGGLTLPQWQHELTSGGRIWYCPDKDGRIIWVTKVALAHPKATD